MCSPTCPSCACAGAAFLVLVVVVLRVVLAVLVLRVVLVVLARGIGALLSTVESRRRAECTGEPPSADSPRAAAMGPMAEVVFRSTQYLSADDVRAIAAYLRSFAQSPVEPTPLPKPDADVVARGALVYEDRCAECHGSNGEGVLPAYPPLARNPSVTETLPANAIKAVLNGGYAPATAANPRPYGMPPFVKRLTADEIAAVLTYVRASWGNSGAPVSTFDVERYQ